MFSTTVETIDRTVMTETMPSIPMSVVISSVESGIHGIEITTSIIPSELCQGWSDP